MLQEAAVKVPILTQEVMTKYQRIAHFAIGPHIVYVHAWRDPAKKWVAMRYKMSDTKLEAEINGFHEEWFEPISIAQASKEKPTDALEDPVCKDDHQSDDDSSTETPTNPKMWCIIQEIRAKKHMDQVVHNNTASTMEAQLHKLVKAVNDVTDASTK